MNKDLTCLLVLVLLALGCVSQPPHVIYISLDCTRWDYIDVGDGREACADTPELKRFAGTCCVFRHAFSAIPQTLPSHLTVFTGAYPFQHGVFRNDQQYDGRLPMIQQVLARHGYQTGAVISLGTISGKTGINRGFQQFNEDLFQPHIFYVPAAQVTDAARQMASTMKQRGKPFFLFVHYSDPHTPYAPPEVEGTFSILLNGTVVSRFNPYQGAILRLEQPLPPGPSRLELSHTADGGDFSSFTLRKLSFSDNCTVAYQNITFSPALYEGAHKLKGTAGAVDIRCNGTGRLSLFQVIPQLSRRSALENYGLEVRYMDRETGRLVRWLDQSGLLKQSVVVLFGDHGEGLGEREMYFGHVRYLNQQFLHVPLLLHLPGYDHRLIQAPVSLASVSPTICDYLGIEGLHRTAAASFLPLVRGNAHEPPLLFAFTRDCKEGDQRFSLIRYPYQAIYTLQGNRIKKKELYNLAVSNSFREQDACNETVLAAQDASVMPFFAQHADAMTNLLTAGAGDTSQMDAEYVEQLRALGYVH